MKRARLVSAAAQVVEEVGYEHVTVARVVARARVSRKTFYDAFVNREDCMVALFDSAIEQARTALRACRHEGWRETMRSALAQILRLIDEEPGLARFCVVEALAGGELLLERYVELAGELARFVDSGRRVARAELGPPPIAAEGVVGAVAHLLHKRLCRTVGEPVSDLLGSLMSIVVLPYLGESVAREEQARRAPAQKPVPRRAAAGPHRLVGLSRITYRTARVLSVIHANPGISNREVGMRAGIDDQGQVSKLLSRLAAHGLVANHGLGQRHGATNSWRLTSRGAEVEHAVRPRFSPLDLDSAPGLRRDSGRASAAR
jgi:AcrR family transcriptional regulator